MPPSVANLFLRAFPGAKEFVLLIQEMPFLWRKVFLNECQLGVNENTPTLDQIRTLLLHESLWYDGRLVTATTILGFFKYIHQSSSSKRGAFIALLRSSPIDIIYIEAAIQAGISKEVSALMDVKFEDSQFSYRFLYGIPDRTSYPGWIQEVGRNIARVFISKVPKHILFPYINSRKNIGRESAEAYNRHRSKDPIDVTTADLEMLYYEDNIHVSGPCEVRTAFKFNDLKPRVYFAQGASAHNASKYIKPIAVTMMESLQGSREINRRDPILYLNQNSSWEGDFVMNWDLTSFTSALQELKHFVYFFARSIEKIGDVKVRLFDWRTGVHKASLVSLLDDYNEQMNVHPEFSLIRLVEDIENDHLSSRNGGLLGVPGNIGMSTFLHALISERIAGQGNVICVGDDAMMAGSTEQQVGSMTSSIESLGIIERSKFKTLQGSGQTKFLKRLVEYSPDGLVIHDFLPSLTTIPDAYGIKIPGRTQGDTDRYSCAKRACVDLGRILWSIKNRYHDCNDNEIQDISTYYREIYRFHQLPISGGLPGQVHLDLGKGSKITNRFVVPPIPGNFYDPRVIDWDEYLLQNCPWNYAIIPKTVEFPIFLNHPIIVGDEQFITRSPFTEYLETIGLVSLEEVQTAIDLRSPVNRRRLQGWLKGKGRAVSMCLILKPFPEYLMHDELVSFSAHSVTPYDSSSWD